MPAIEHGILGAVSLERDGMAQAQSGRRLKSSPRAGEDGVISREGWDGVTRREEWEAEAVWCVKLWRNAAAAFRTVESVEDKHFEAICRPDSQSFRPWATRSRATMTGGRRSSDLESRRSRLAAARNWPRKIRTSASSMI